MKLQAGGVLTLIVSNNENEQGFEVRTCGDASRQIVDIDGIQLVAH